MIKENAEEDKIVVIKIYAGFCRACKAFDRKFRLLSLDFEEQGANVKFFEMDWMKTRELCKALQVGILSALLLVDLCTRSIVRGGGREHA